MGTVSYTIPWDLRRRGLQDSRRHDQRVREAIRKNLRHLITEEAIITSDGQRMVKLPIRYLDLYRFRYSNEEAAGGVGQGEGKQGDVVAREPAQGLPTDQPGDLPGQPVYEAEFSVEELARMMLEDLKLPWLEEKRAAKNQVPHQAVREVRRHGLLPNLDKRRTLYENLKRQAAKGRPSVGPITDADLRYRVWSDEPLQRTRAAVYMLMDRSGSMTTEKKYIAKCFFFWLVRFLRLKYQNVDLVFIAHDYEAQITDEQSFFAISNSGGTRCSSAYEVALQHLREHHPASDWNNYIFHFSDGDNYPSDNPRCVELVLELLQHARMVGCGEICYRDWDGFYYSQTTFGRARSPLFEALSKIEHPRFLQVSIEKREDVHAALSAFLKEHGQREATA